MNDLSPAAAVVAATIAAWRDLLRIAQARGDHDHAAWIADRILDALRPVTHGHPIPPRSTP